MAETPTTSKRARGISPSLRSFMESPRPPDPSSPVQNNYIDMEEQNQKIGTPFCKRLFKYLYNADAKTVCERSWQNWVAIIGYSIMYLIFLCTYTMIFLYVSLLILQQTIDYSAGASEKTEMLTYSEYGIGLTATPAAVGTYPIIWYKNNDTSDYEKYVNAIDSMLKKSRSKRETNTNLGPCGTPPYGYGDKPCILIRINKQLKWSGTPLQVNSTYSKAAPREVQEWMTMDKKLWLRCNGYYSYDKEHVGSIKYYPDPPGFNPDVFPLDMEGNSPVVAIQISDFTLGLSLAIECKLWYENGPSSVEFMLYVAPADKALSNRTYL